MEVRHRYEIQRKSLNSSRDFIFFYPFIPHISQSFSELSYGTCTSEGYEILTIICDNATEITG